MTPSFIYFSEECILCFSLFSRNRINMTIVWKTFCVVVVIAGSSCRKSGEWPHITDICQWIIWIAPESYVIILINYSLSLTPKILQTKTSKHFNWQLICGEWLTHVTHLPTHETNDHSQVSTFAPASHFYTYTDTTMTTQRFRGRSPSSSVESGSISSTGNPTPTSDSSSPPAPTAPTGCPNPERECPPSSDPPRESQISYHNVRCVEL